MYVFTLWQGYNLLIYVWEELPSVGLGSKEQMLMILNLGTLGTGGKKVNS